MIAMHKHSSVIFIINLYIINKTTGKTLFFDLTNIIKK